MGQNGFADKAQRLGHRAGSGLRARLLNTNGKTEP